MTSWRRLVEPSLGAASSASYFKLFVHLPKYQLSIAQGRGRTILRRPRGYQSIDCLAGYFNDSKRCQRPNLTGGHNRRGP
jgi:hypothetical protein